MKKIPWMNRLLVLLSVCISLLLAEFIVSFLPQKHFPQIHYKRYPVYRPELGVITNIPNSCQIISTQWVYNKICYNKWGFRGPDWNLEKNGGEIRVAVLGDSYVEGREVKYNKVLSTVLERKLGPKYTVLNFGLSGSGQSEQLRIYRNIVKKFKPDIVISFITPSNDFEDNIEELSGRTYGVFLEIKNGHLVEIGPPRWTTLFLSPKICGITDWIGNLALSKLILHALVQKENTLPIPFSPRTAWASKNILPLDPLKKFNTVAYNEAKKVMKAALLRLKKICEKDGARFVLVSTTGCWTFMTLDNRKNRKWAEKAELLSLRYKWISEFAEKYRVEYLDLKPAFLQEYHTKKLTSADIHIPWDSHWTVLGHQLAATKMYTFLRENVDSQLPLTH